MGFTFPKVYNTYFLAIVSTIGGMLFGMNSNVSTSKTVSDRI